MRLATYDRGGARSLGAWAGTELVDLPEAVGHPAFPATLEALVIRRRGSSMEAARAALANPDDLEQAVVARPGLLAPLVLAGPGHGRVVGPGEGVPWPAETPCDWQPELACVLGRSGRNLSVTEASNAIFGYLLVSAWSEPATSETERRRMATALGPCLVTAEGFDPTDITLTARINRGVWIRERIGDAPSRFARTVARASVRREVQAGEVFSSPPFAASRLEPRRLTHDATVEIEAGHLGLLRNRVRFRRTAQSTRPMPRAHEVA